MWNISQETMSLWDMLVYVAIIKATKMMLTDIFNSKDTGVLDVIQEMKISSTSDGLVSITWEMWHSLVRTPYMKSICIFLGSLYKSKQTCIVGYLCLSYCIRRGGFWLWTFLCERLLDILANQWTRCFWTISRLCIPRQ